MRYHGIPFYLFVVLIENWNLRAEQTKRKGRKERFRDFTESSSNGILFDFVDLNYFHHVIEERESFTFFSDIAWVASKMCFLAPFEIFGICACLLLVNWFNSVQFAGSYAKNQPRSFHNGESNLNRNCEITLRNVNTCWISTVLFVLFSISCDTVIISTGLPFVIFHSKKIPKIWKKHLHWPSWHRSMQPMHIHRLALLFSSVSAWWLCVCVSFCLFVFLCNITDCNLRLWFNYHSNEERKRTNKYVETKTTTFDL